MKTLPENVTAYKRTKLFTSENIPGALLREHSTAENVWGVLHVTIGNITFYNDETGEETVLGKDDDFVISPAMRHHLEINSYAEFYVEFYR